MGIELGQETLFPYLQIIFPELYLPNFSREVDE
jgi:hypothetical protein